MPDEARGAEANKTLRALKKPDGNLQANYGTVARYSSCVAAPPATAGVDLVRGVVIGSVIGSVIG